MNRFCQFLTGFIAILILAFVVPARAATGEIVDFTLSTPYPDEPGCSTSFLTLVYTGTFTTDDFNGSDFMAALIFDSQGSLVAPMITAAKPVDRPSFGSAFPFTSFHTLPAGEIHATLYDLPTITNDFPDWISWIIANGVVLDTATLQEPEQGWFDCGQLAPGGIPFNLQDGRLNPDPSAPAVIYAPDDGSLQIYAVDANGNGYLALYVSPEEVAALPDSPEENLQIAQSDDGKISLYRLTTNELQLNAGPDFEGKVFVYIFGGDPLVLVNQYTFMDEG